MNREKARHWAAQRASEIVKREGGELCLSARELDYPAIEANSTLLGAAIAGAMLEAFEEGWAAALDEKRQA